MPRLVALRCPPNVRPGERLSLRCRVGVEPRLDETSSDAMSGGRLHPPATGGALRLLDG